MEHLLAAVLAAGSLGVGLLAIAAALRVQRPAGPQRRRTAATLREPLPPYEPPPYEPSRRGPPEGIVELDAVRRTRIFAAPGTGGR